MSVCLSRIYFLIYFVYKCFDGHSSSRKLFLLILIYSSFDVGKFFSISLSLLSFIPSYGLLSIYISSYQSLLHNAVDLNNHGNGFGFPEDDESARIPRAGPEETWKRRRWREEDDGEEEEEKEEKEEDRKKKSVPKETEKKRVNRCDLNRTQVKEESFSKQEKRKTESLSLLQ